MKRFVNALLTFALFAIVIFNPVEIKSQKALKAISRVSKNIAMKKTTVLLPSLSAKQLLIGVKPLEIPPTKILEIPNNPKLNLKDKETIAVMLKIDSITEIHRQQIEAIQYRLNVDSINNNPNDSVTHKRILPTLRLSKSQNNNLQNNANETINSCESIEKKKQ